VALYISFGADVLEVKKVWRTRRAKGEKKPHGVADHWHAECLVKWDDGKKTVLEDVCAPGELRADGGWTEISSAMEGAPQEMVGTELNQLLRFK
jgi:methyl coenzyme M reductase alpha subunit